MCPKGSCIIDQTVSLSLDCVSKGTSVILEICTKILVVLSKINQYFPCLNWKHLSWNFFIKLFGEKKD